MLFPEILFKANMCCGVGPCIILVVKQELIKSANADPPVMFHSEFGNSVVNKLSLPYENIWTLKAQDTWEHYIVPDYPLCFVHLLLLQYSTTTSSFVLSKGAPTHFKDNIKLLNQGGLKLANLKRLHIFESLQPRGCS